MTATNRLSPTLGKRRSRASAAAPDTGGQIMMPGGQTIPLDTFISLTSGSGSGFSGTTPLGKERSFVVFPELDTRKEITHWSRMEMLRRARWLYNNVGFAKRIVLSLSRMMGALHPSPQTPDSNWNEEALAAFWRVAKAPLLYERSGKFQFRTYQRFLSRRWLIDGDVLSVFTRGAGGSTMVAPYEAHQISNPMQRSGRYNLPTEQDGWFDGVKVDRGHRLQKCRVLHPDDPAKYTDFDAAEAHLTAFWERVGQPRGVTPFHAAITRMLDVRDLTRDMMAGIKRSNLIGFYLHASNPGTPILGEDGLAGGLKDYLKEAGGENALDQAAATFKIEEVMESGVIPETPGFEPKVLHDARPHPHQMALISWFVREMSLSFDLPPEVIWDLGSLNGNTSRLLKEDVEQVLVNYRDEILEPFCQRNWFHLIGNEIAAGRLREPDAGRWDDVEWKHPRKKTIDRGAEGRLNIEESRIPGLRTLDRHFSELQEDWRDEGTKWFAEVEWFTKKAREQKWTEEEIAALRLRWLAPPPGTAPVTSEAPAEPKSAPDAQPTPTASGVGQALNL